MNQFKSAYRNDPEYKTLQDLCDLYGEQWDRISDVWHYYFDTYGNFSPEETIAWDIYCDVQETYNALQRTRMEYRYARIHGYI